MADDPRLMAGSQACPPPTRHMLRHACGFALPTRGRHVADQDYVGHRNIQHIVRYTTTNPARFETALAVRCVAKINVFWYRCTYGTDIV